MTDEQIRVEQQELLEIEKIVNDDRLTVEDQYVQMKQNLTA